MECAECGHKREPDERGWVVVLSRPDKPRILYCPDCLAALVRCASGEDDPGDDDRTTEPAERR
jgi:hypothetical protein